MHLQVVYLCLGLSFAAVGCAKVKAAVCADMVPAPKPDAAIAASNALNAKTGKPEESLENTETEPAGEATDAAKEPAAPQDAFALPFAWERSPTEPLSRTRAYLRDMVRDNAQYMKHGSDFFKALANAEVPRATVLSCADSRVQSPAFDATPENDNFTVRNLGNQVRTGLGALQYGVEHLNTPLLVVLGHTGCGAVRAALTGTSKLSEPIRNELAGLRLPRYKGKKPLDDELARDAVLRNVHDQVEFALTTFAARVNAGQLTIIGAVYDFRNDLDKGAGKLSIVNVNGVTQAARLDAFHAAVLAGANVDSTSVKRVVDPFEKLSQVFAEHLHESDEDDEGDPKQAPATLAPMEHAPTVVIPRPTTTPKKTETVPAKKAAPH